MSLHTVPSLLGLMPEIFPSEMSPSAMIMHDYRGRAQLTRNSPTVCCIYHAPRQVGESSDESSSSSDGSSSDEQDSSDDDGAARMSGNRRAQQKPRHEHDKINGDGDQAQPHADVCQDPDHDHGPKGKRVSKRKSGNAYEKMPKSKGNSTTVIEGKR